MSSAETAPGSTPARLRRFARRALQLLGLLLTLLAGASAFALHDLDGKARGALLEAAREIEAQTGRHVALGTVHVSLGYTTEIVVRSIVVEAAPGAAGALAEAPLRVPSARLAVGLARLVRSRGTEIDVARFELEAPEFTLVRTDEGLSIDDIRARRGAAPAAPPSRHRVTVQKLAISGARLRLITQGGEPGTDFTIAVGGTDLRLDGSSPSRVSVEASTGVAGAGAVIAIDLAPAADGGASSVPIRRVEARMQGLPLGPLLAFARVDGPGGVDLSGALLGADLVVELAAAISVKGRLEVDRLRLDGAAPSKLSIGADVTLEPATSAMSARDLDIRLGDIGVRGSLRAHGQGPSLSVDDLDLTGSADAAALVALVPAARRPAGVALAGPVSLAVRGAGGLAEAHASIQFGLTELRVLDRADPPAGGKPTRLDATAELTFCRRDGTLRLDRLGLRLGELSLRGRVELGDLAGPETALSLRALSLEGGGPLEGLLALAPASHRPRGVALQGAFSASLEAHRDGQDLQGRAKLDLGRARIRAAAFSKPPGLPLGADVEGRAAKVGVTITRSRLQLGPLVASAQGKIEGPERMELSFDERGATVASLLAMFPGAAARLGDVSVEGSLAVKGKLRRVPGKTTLDATARLDGARLQRDTALLVGDPEVTTHIEAEKDTISAHTDLDLGPAAISIAPFFAKPAGSPTRVAFTLDRRGEHVHIKDARASLPGVSLSGLDIVSDPGHLHLSATGASLAIGPLLEISPLLGRVIPESMRATTARFALDLDGDPDKIESMSLGLRSIELAGGFGRVRGSLAVDGLPHPRALRLDVLGGDLEIGPDAGPDGASRSPSVDPGAPRIEGRIHLDSLRLSGQTLRAIDADISLDHARVNVRRLHAEALGGTIDVDRSTLDLAGTPSFDLHTRLTGLDLSRIPGAQPLELRGRASASFELRGAGASWEAASRSLSGTAQATLRDLHARPTVQPKISLVNPILSQIAARFATANPGPAKDLDLRQVSMAFDVSAGKLTTTTPILLLSEDFNASLRGQLGLDQSIALEGQVDINREMIARATKNRITPARPIPLRLKLSGKTDDIRLELLEPDGTPLVLDDAP